jgi:hypothetical protein
VSGAVREQSPAREGWVVRGIDHRGKFFGDCHGLVIGACEFQCEHKDGAGMNVDHGMAPHHDAAPVDPPFGCADRGIRTAQ